ncbi:MAG: insulinase family protein [Paludibacteraceae bacterium]|nr:insulinase family protein [Paludibacteraceae bacterium]
MRKFFIFLSLLISAALCAQEQDIPSDPAVRYGKLDNGLTYYIRKNTFVPGRANFYIVQNVGSILEKPEQRGLAHFLEHMAFNGSKHFPDKQLIHYLETLGVKFGANLNAYTSVDRTVYLFIDVPVQRASTVDSCLLILRDWSDGILLKDDEIEKERGVIEEEWRTTDSYMMRMYEQIMPIIYAGTKYSDCMPIGSMDVVRNFKPETLRAYYKEWYRPDLQGVIVVGDIDTDYVLNKLDSIFMDCKVPDNASKRIWYPVMDNKEPIIVSTRDKENPNAGFMLAFKHDVVPREQKNTPQYFVYEFAKVAINQMLNARFEELMQKPDAPFVGVSIDDDEFMLSATKDAFTYYTACSDANLRKALVRVLEENERMSRYGFTAGEYERAKADIIKSLETRFNEREKTPNANYVQEYIANFTSGEPFPGIEAEYMMYQQIASILPLEQVNEMAKMPLDSGNVVIWLRGTEKDRVEFPSGDEIKAIMDSITHADIKPYEDTSINEPLVGDINEGSIVSENITDDGVYQLKLSNGVCVEVKPTKLKEDEVLMSAISVGGISSFYKEGDNVPTLKLLNDMASVGGLGKFSAIDLRKALAGKNASMNINIGDYVTSVGGSASVSDVETMMQLIYLGFTAVREDDEAFRSLMNQYEAYLKNIEVNPKTTLTDSLISLLFNDNPYKLRLRADDIQKVSYTEGLNIIADQMSNASAFKFAFTGNIRMKEFRPLVCKYIASLPSGKKSPKVKDIGIETVKGERSVTYRTPMENPKTTVIKAMSMPMDYNLKNLIQSDVLRYILRVVYTESVREENGGTYGVGVRVTPDALPYNRLFIQFNFDTDSAKYKALEPKLIAEMEKIAADGPRATDLQKAKEYLLKVYTDSQVQNGYWLGVKTEEFITGLDKHTDYEDLVKSLSADDVKEYVKDILKKAEIKELVQIGTK